MLLELSVFPPADMGGDVIAAAMNVVAQGDALIIDLRRNGGGSETANLVTGYLLDRPNQPLSGTYDRPSDTTRGGVITWDRNTVPSCPGTPLATVPPAAIAESRMPLPGTRYI
jgi:hypothetical protein